MKNCGIVISLEDSPSTTKFSFVIDPESKNEVKKGQYIQTESESGLVFGYINEITRANRYFERAESVAEYEKIGGLKQNFPVDSWEYLVADVKILGTFTEKKFLRTSLPPYPGSKVNIADGEMLTEFLGFVEGGLNIGELEYHNIDVKIDMTRLLQKHLAILAMSGAGKSHLMSVIMEELLSRKKEQGRIATVVIDIHGEYLGFRHDDNFRKNVKVIEGKNLFVPLRKLGPGYLEEWVELSYPQKQILKNVLYELRSKAKQERKSYSMKELIEKIDEDKGDQKVKNALKRSISEIMKYRFVSRNKENPKLIDDIKPGQLLLFDFSTIDNLRKKQILTAMIARRLFNLRKKGKIPPVLLVIEEAHNFAKERAERYEAVSKGIIETVAREGRKFGTALCLISQRPVNLSTTALSQCNTHIIMRITNPYDLDQIQKSSEAIDGRTKAMITNLKRGEAIVVGNAINYPVFVNIRDRKSVKIEKGEPLHKQAIDFEASKEKRTKDVEAFM